MRDTAKNHAACVASRAGGSGWIACVELLTIAKTAHGSTDED
jgi:hypothetical protein